MGTYCIIFIWTHPAPASLLRPPFSGVTQMPGPGRLQTGERKRAKLMSGPALVWGQACHIQVLVAANLLSFIGAEDPETPRRSPGLLSSLGPACATSKLTLQT